MEALRNAFRKELKAAEELLRNGICKMICLQGVMLDMNESTAGTSAIEDFLRTQNEVLNKLPFEYDFHSWSLEFATA